MREQCSVLSGKAPGAPPRAEGLKQNDIVKIVGERWRAITPAQLQDYKMRAAAITAEMQGGGGVAAAADSPVAPSVAPSVAPDGIGDEGEDDGAATSAASVAAKAAAEVLGHLSVPRPAGIKETTPV